MAGATTNVCNHGQSNANKSVVGSIMEVMAIAVAGINTAAAISIADKQYDIAKDYLDIAKWWRNYYNSTYKPWENKELEEAWALEEEKPMYDITVGRTRTFGRIQSKGMAEAAIRCTSEYCTGLRGALLKDALNAEATSLAALSNLGYRNERAYIEARNDVRWERRANVLNRGRDMIANNIQFSQLSFGIFGDLLTQAGKGAAGAIGYLGYSWNRNETQYPVFARGVVTAQPQPQRSTVTVTPLTEPSRPSYRSGVVFDNGSNVGQAAK